MYSYRSHFYFVIIKIMEYMNDNCADENIYLLEEKYDEILDILMDLENESDEINPMIVEINALTTATIAL